MKPFQLPPSPRRFDDVNGRTVHEPFVFISKGVIPLVSFAAWATMPGRTRREKRKNYFSLKKKDRPTNETTD